MSKEKRLYLKPISQGVVVGVVFYLTVELFNLSFSLENKDSWPINAFTILSTQAFVFLFASEVKKKWKEDHPKIENGMNVRENMRKKNKRIIKFLLVVTLIFLMLQVVEEKTKYEPITDIKRQISTVLEGVSLNTGTNGHRDTTE